MRTEQTPEWIIRLWPKIVEAANEIGGWFEGYSHGYGFGGTDDAPEDGAVSQPPSSMVVYDEGDEAQDELDEAFAVSEEAGRAKKNEPHGKMRDWSERGVEHPFPEFTFGTFVIFRVSNEDHAKLNEGYEDSAGTENERFIQDGGDHTVVVYMI